MIFNLKIGAKSHSLLRFAPLSVQIYVYVHNKKNKHQLFK